MAGNLSSEELDAAIEAGEIDTVVVAFPTLRVDSSATRGRAILARRGTGHGAEACNYLLSVDVDLNTVDGYAMSSWEKATATCCSSPTRHAPPHPLAARTALVFADLAL